MAAPKGSSFLTISPQQAGALARRGSAVIVARVTERTAMRAAALAPGKMKGAVRPIITGGSNPLGIVMVDHPATHYVLYGTRPHKIYPKRKGGVLRFSVGGQIVFARYVSHPGTKPNNFLLKALMESRIA
jgi:hypothetical protein